MSDDIPFVGQWVGTLSGPSGASEAALVLNVDHDLPGVGVIHLDYFQPRQFFYALAHVVASESRIEGSVSQFSAPPEQGDAVTLPTSATFSGRLQNRVARGTWETNISTAGTFEMVGEWAVPGRADHTLSWTQFVDVAMKDANSPLIYRGQDSSCHALTTAFHRRKRCDLGRFARDHVRSLGRQLESVVHRTIDVDRELAWLLGLAQHHGFPTPLQDWTESPFVAAFFAFNTLPKDERKLAHQKVRIFKFDVSNWPKSWGTVSDIGDIGPRFAPLLVGTSHNQRAMPQQSVHMFSNLVDIERFIRGIEHNDASGPKYLTCIDIPATERAVAMRDLRRMGITAASMFPGLDGICRALAEQFF
jgi:hypothetical protein